MTIVAIPKEVKNHEYRVGATTSTVLELKRLGHSVLIESNAGLAIGITNEMYVQSGAEIVQSAGEIYAKGELILKVKEPESMTKCSQTFTERDS